jgi:hypothetical protein
MSLGQKLTEKLESLAGLTAPQTSTIRVTETGEEVLELDLTGVDRMSCSFRELRLQLPGLYGKSFDSLKDWANEICKRVTYLLEQIGPQELDPESEQVLIRSTPPEKNPGQTRFYEVLLSAPGTLGLRRYCARSGQAGREQIDLQTTHEVACKLVNDIIQAAAKL